MMQDDRERSRRRKALWLLLPLILLGTIGGVLAAINGDDKPGSDVLGLHVRSTTERSGSQSDSSGTSPGAPASSDTTKSGGSGEGSSGSGGTVGAAAKPGGSDTTPEPPAITKKPDDPTFDTSAQFKFTGSESGLGFRCKLDSGTSSLCNSGTSNYNKLPVGEHTFQVTAFDVAGNVSLPASYTWTILLRSGFEITGSLDQSLSPGTSQRLNLSLGNPYNFPLKVLGIQVTVDDVTTTNDGAPNPGCIGSHNLEAQGLTVEVVVPANSTKSLSQLQPPLPQNQWPLIQMLNLGTNQDACKNTTFKLSYEGTGTKA